MREGYVNAIGRKLGPLLFGLANMHVTNEITMGTLIVILARR